MREVITWCDRCTANDIRTPGVPRPGYMVDGQPLDPPPDLCDDCDKGYGDPLRELRQLLTYPTSGQQPAAPASSGEEAPAAPGGRVYRCDNCEQEFPRKAIFEEHLNEHGDHECLHPGCRHRSTAAQGRGAHMRFRHGTEGASKNAEIYRKRRAGK